MKKSEVLAFLDKQNDFILNTINLEGVPESRALINIRNPRIAPHLKEFFKNDGRIFIITNTHSDKIPQIRKNNAASVYLFDQQYNGLLLLGKVREVLDVKTKHTLWDDSWKSYYPGGKDDKDFSVLEFVPESFKSYSGSDFAKEKGKIQE
jgi:general stress protein 26